MDKPLAPGTLSDDEQRRLVAQIIQLVKSAFGRDAEVALTVMRLVRKDGHEGVALYSMGSAPDSVTLAHMFSFAATELRHSQQRVLALEDEPQVMQ